MLTRLGPTALGTPTRCAAEPSSPARAARCYVRPEASSTATMSSPAKGISNSPSTRTTSVILTNHSSIPQGHRNRLDAHVRFGEALDALT